MSRVHAAVVVLAAAFLIIDGNGLVGPPRVGSRGIATIFVAVGGTSWFLKKLKALPWSGITRVLTCGALFSLIMFWEYLVNKNVPEPYLDEVFHVPQAQRYCQADFTWDDKITTPPGLYVASISIIRTVMTKTICSVSDLRATNGILLSFLGTTAYICRSSIDTQHLNPSRTEHVNKELQECNSAYKLHTAANIVLFPPLFFFSGLYYTDIISTYVVLVAYSEFLKRRDLPIIRMQHDTLLFSLSMSSGFIVFLLGLLALTMRQTNIFWVAIFLGGLHVVRSLKTLSLLKTPPNATVWKAFDVLSQQANAGVFDPSLRESSIFDWITCVYSIAITALFNLKLVAAQLWPYVGMILAFAGFVIVNGGVVLGDKSNHVATIHLPQMLYIWIFFIFFSAPLLYPYAIETLLRFRNTVVGGYQTTNPKTGKQIQHQVWFKAVLTIGALCITLAIIHFNTIIHPFTLADNRHYVFYAFRYTILRHPLVKYALAPVYLGCAWLTYLGLAGPDRSKSNGTSTSETKSAEKTVSPPQEKPSLLSPPPQQYRTDTSFLIIWLVSTVLSLITAPLVEPRYFIIPWVIWRLHVPALPPKSSQSGFQHWAYAGHDHRLWLETFWFLAINAVTGWVFLYKGFEWPQEMGLVQRFMW